MSQGLRERGPYLLLAVALVGVGVSAWRPIPAGVWHDDGVYMLVGKALASGQGFVYDGVSGTPPAAKFPPVYPALLGVLWALFREIGTVTAVAVAWNLVALAGAGALFARALHVGAGLPLGGALVAAALGFTSTDLLRTALIPLSEPTFLLLLCGAFALWAEVQRGAGTGRVWAGLAALLALSVATRSAGVVAVIAFAIAVVQRGVASKSPDEAASEESTVGHRSGPAPWRGLGRTLAVTTLPALAVAIGWGRWSSAATERIPEGARDLLGSYGGWWADQALQSSGALLSGLPSHAIGVFSRAAAIFVPGATGTVLALAAAVVVPLVLTGIAVLLRRFPPLGWFVLGYFALLLLWPYLDRRLVAPIHPALVGAAAVGLLSIIERFGHKAIKPTLSVVAAAWVLSFSVVTAYRVADGWPTDPYRLRAERLAASVQALSTTARPGAVVGAPEFWAALHLHGGYTVAPSVRFDPRSTDPEAPMWGTPDEQIELWRAAGIDHLVLEQAGQLHSAALDQLEDGCPGSVFVLAQMRGSLIVYIDWDADCDNG